MTLVPVNLVHLDQFDLNLTESDPETQPLLNYDTQSASDLTNLPSEEDFQTILDILYPPEPTVTSSSSDGSAVPLPADNPANNASPSPPSSADLSREEKIRLRRKKNRQRKWQEKRNPTPKAKPPSSTDLSREEKIRLRRKKNRQRKRQENRDPTRKAESAAKLKKKIYGAAERFSVSLATDSLKTSKPGFIGVKPQLPASPVQWTQIPRPAGPNPPTAALVDSKGCIFAIRGTPSGPRAPADFAENLWSAVQELDQKSHASKSAHNSRGAYDSIKLGISYGGGQQEPSKFKDEADPAALEDFKSNTYVQDCIHQVKNFFKMWSPRLFQYYEKTMTSVEEKHQLRRPFPGLPLMACTVNFGPQVITLPHKDFKNLAFGLCAIVMLGNFNHKTGGKLCLEDVGIELEVAPGDIVLLPSASITHYNTIISEGEKRSSITFYTSGQMFRWAHDGYHPVKSLSPAEKKRGEQNGKKIREAGWNLYLRESEIGERVITCP